MVQLTIECETGSPGDSLCQRVDEWRRLLFPVSEHLDAEESYAENGEGWRLRTRRAGTVGEIQNVVEESIRSGQPRSPIRIAHFEVTDDKLTLIVEPGRTLKVH